MLHVAAFVAIGLTLRAGTHTARTQSLTMVEQALTVDTQWRLRLRLSMPDAAADAPLELTANVRFGEEVGYEPPQGLLRVESSLPEGVLATGDQPKRWKLSEDPDDPKDSLWIWGLFKEPLYPFILFSLRTAEALELPGAADAIPAGTELYFQGEHRRDPKTGVRLGEGEVSLRVPEELLTVTGQALAGVEYEDKVPCGSFCFLDSQ